MTPAHRILATAIRPAPVGLRFRDVATGLPVRDGLSVTVTPTRNPGRRFALERNGNGVWFAHRFPGLSDFALGTTEDWSTIDQPCRIEVTDAFARFQPLVLDLDLPVRGLAEWPGWSALPAALLAPLTDTDIGVSPPVITICANQIALFSSASRTPPAPLAEIRAQLALDSGGPAAWTLLTASHGGRVRAIGQADASGSVVLFFAYPERPRPSLATSPPAITDFRWSIDVTAYWNALDPAVVPEFGALMDQLNHPRELFADTHASPPELLPSQLLSLGKPMVLRTADTPDGPSSRLTMRAS